MATKKKRTKARPGVPPPPENTCASQVSACVPPDTEAVKLVKKIENKNSAISSLRNSINYHNVEAARLKDSLHAELLNHQLMNSELTKLTATPKVLQ